MLREPNRHDRHHGWHKQQPRPRLQRKKGASSSNMDDDEEDDDEEEEEKEPERVTAESYGSLDTTNVTDECWLIRVPNKLYEQWKDLPEGTDLGELVFSKGGGGATSNSSGGPAARANHNTAAAAAAAAAAAKNSLTIHVNEASISAETNVPLVYNLAAMTKKIPAMHPFVRNANTGACTIFGTVTRTANLQVAAAQTDGKYRAMLKDRLAATNLRDKGFVKSIDHPAMVATAASGTTTGGGGGAAALPGKNGGGNNKKRSFGNAVLEFGRRKLEAQDSAGGNNNGPAKVSSSGGGGDHAASSSSSAKKSRQFAAGESVRSVLFALFGVERYWTSKDLKNAAISGGFDMTKRAEAEMRDLLRNELAIYHRSGDHKNQWELKEEFRQGGGADDGQDGKDTANL
jgi:hypothetical protein